MSEERRPGALDGSTEEDARLGNQAAPDDGADGGEAFEPEAEDALEGDLDDAGEEAHPQDQAARDLARDVPRETQRQRRQRAERQLADERRARQDLEGRLAALERNNAAPRPDPAELARREREEQERVALLPIEQQSRYWYDKGRQEFGGALLGLQQQMADNADRADFGRMLERSALARQLEPEVERMVAQERARGNASVSRTAVLNYLVGRRVLDGTLPSRDSARNGAAAQRRRQTTRPASAGSGVARPAQRPNADRDAYQRRLEQYRF